MRKAAKSRFVLPLGLAIAALLVSHAFAADYYTWNTTSGDWSTAANWTGGEPEDKDNDRSYVDNGGTVAITQSGEVSYLLYFGRSSGTSGHAQMSSGELNVGFQEFVAHSGTGTFTQTGGEHYVGNTLYTGQGSNGTGTYYLKGGLLSPANSHHGLYGTGVVEQTGGTYGGGTITLALYTGNGTFNFGNATSTGTISARSIYVGPISSANRAGSGTFRGWGTVSSTNSLRNSGQVIADGYETDRTLGMTNFSSVINDLDDILQGNGTYAGWYARDHGKLTLPTLTIGSGNSQANWGESAADTTIDLINSMRLEFSNVAGGSLPISLLATDRDDISSLPAVGNDVIGAWDIDGSSFDFGTGSATVTIRYDHLAASATGFGQSGLKLFHLSGSQWVDITGSLDTTNNWITSSAITSFSRFAVASVPEPSTFLLLSVGLLALLVGRRRPR